MGRFGICVSFIVAAALAGVGCAAHVAPPVVTAAVDETAKTAEAVIAVDHHWGDAETGGDTAYVADLLLPGYRSITPNGVAYSRAALLAHATRNTDPRTRDAARATADEYRRTHPSNASVVLVDDTAVLTFYAPALGLEKGVRSSDVFVYRNGRWHALYSQHSAL